MTYQNRENWTDSTWNILRTPSTGSIQPELMTEDYNSGTQGLIPKLYTTLCRQTASTKLRLKDENELHLKDSRCLVAHRWLYFRVRGNRSSSNSSSNNKTPLRVCPKNTQRQETGAEYWITCGEEPEFQSRPHNWRNCTRCNHWNNERTVENPRSSGRWEKCLTHEIYCGRSGTNTKLLWNSQRNQVA